MYRDERSFAAELHSPGFVVLDGGLASHLEALGADPSGELWPAGGAAPCGLRRGDSNRQQPTGFSGTWKLERLAPSNAFKKHMNGL